MASEVEITATHKERNFASTSRWTKSHKTSLVSQKIRRVFFFFFKWRQTKRCCFCRASYKTTNWPLMSPWMAKSVFAAIKFCFCEDEMAETGTKKNMFLKMSPLTLILGSLLLEMTVDVTSCVRRKVAEHGRWVESPPLSVQQMSHCKVFWETFINSNVANIRINGFSAFMLELSWTNITKFSWFYVYLQGLFRDIRHLRCHPPPRKKKKRIKQHHFLKHALRLLPISRTS